jgi:transposase
VVNPTHVHNYAKSLPRRSKTDALDAHLLLHVAIERQPPSWTPPPQVYHELRQRLVARDALLEMRQQARNHRHALAQWPVQIAAVKAQLDAVIADLDTRMGTLEHEIAVVLREHAWAKSATLLQTIHRIGPLTTAWLFVGTLNFRGCATPAAAVGYVGLAPMLRESGSSVRGRPQIGHGGHKRLRTAVYLATFNAVRFNPVIKALYERLRAVGKPPNVARCAAARKLLQIAWAVVTRGVPFDPEYASHDMFVAAA